MSFFRRLFGPRSGPGRGGVSPTPEQQVAELERQAEGAPLGTKGTLLNRAGDVFMRAGNHGRALDYFRRAIDLLLEAGIGDTVIVCLGAPPRWTAGSVNIPVEAAIMGIVDRLDVSSEVQLPLNCGAPVTIMQTEE